MTITLNRADLDFLLRQVTVNYLVPDGNGGFVESNYFNYSALANAVDPSGLREVSGANNNIVGGHWDPNILNPLTNQFGVWVEGPNTTWGQSNQPFLNLSVGQQDSSAPVSGINGYNNPGGAVSDSAPRLISNLVASMITDPTSPLYNPATADAATNGLPDADFAGLQFNGQDAGFVANAGVLGGGRYNEWFVSFGQFFDHGLDFVNRDPDPTATVTINLSPLDPLYDVDGADNDLATTFDNVNSIQIRRAAVANADEAGGDGIFGTADDAYHAAGADGVMNTADDIYSKARYVNQTGLLIDQSQTYGSHQSVNALIREYTADGRPTGRVVSGNTAVLDTPNTADDALAVGLATWADIKTNALRIGVSLNDTTDLINAPVLRVDPAGKLLFTPSTTDWTTDSIVIGPQSADDPFMRDATTGAVLRTGQNMLIDRNPDISVDQHIITGDGRGNENIGLTAVHHVFHEEHNGQVVNIRNSILAQNDLALLNEWLRVDVVSLPATPEDIAALQWDGERLYQAARLITESEYNHIAIDQYVGTLYGALPEFVSYSSDINPGVSLEFSQAVFRLGHSMLTETFDVIDPNTSQPLKLLDMFLNPTLYQDMIDANGNPADLVFGLTQTLGNEVDEFVTPALQQSLLGQPLDLATINIARGREVGLPTWNEFRDQLYKQYIQNTNNTNSSALAPYNNWADVFDHLKSTGTGVNLIAAYARGGDIDPDTVGVQTNPLAEAIVAAREAYALGTGSLAAIRDAAQALYDAYLNVPGTLLADHDAAVTFMRGTPAYDEGTGQWSFTGSDQGFWDIDLWIGGLAERPLFDGPLGTTFSYVILDFAQRQQDGDRFYYLFRTPMGTNLGNEIIQNQFTNLVSEHTGLTHLNGEIFIREDARYELGPGNDYFNEAEHTIFDVFGEPMPASDGHIVIAGNEGHDFIIAGLGDDTVYGDAGNDTIQGSQGNDHLFGGAGDDLILDDENDDFISGGAGNDRIFAGGGALDTVFGDEGDDELHGGDGIDEVLGGTGDDLIYGDGDTDVLFGDDGNDYIDGGDSVDEMQGQSGNDWMRGGVGDDHLMGGDGNDLLEGGVGPTANDGDRLLGQGVIDFAPAGAAEDDLWVDVASYEDVDIAITANLDTSNENGTGGLLDTYAGVEGLVGSRFNDNLTGADTGTTTSNGIDNLLVGGGGNDILTGLGGDDIIVGDSVKVRSDFTIDNANTGMITNWKATGDDRPLYGTELGHILGETGATGSDTAVFRGNFDDYLIEQITYGGYDALRVTDQRDPTTDGFDGTDILIGMDVGLFADGPISLIPTPPALDLDADHLVTTTTNFSENFSSTSYILDDGAWTQDWIETGDDNNSTAANGQIRITGSELVFDAGNTVAASDGASIARTVDLSGASSATLSFDYDENSLDAGETVLVQFAADGITFTTVQTINSASGEDSSDIVLSGTFGANSAIRFVASSMNLDGDNVQIDNIVVAKNVTTNVPGAPGNNYATTFTEDGASVAIASFPSITDDSTTMRSATIVLTNPQTGDALSIASIPGPDLPAGITASITAGGSMVTLTGTASLAAYQTAIQAVRFSNNSQAPVAGGRIINVTVNDGLWTSNLATATVTVNAVDDPMVANNDTLVTNVVGTLFTVPEWAFLANDTDPDGTTDITAVTESSSGFTAVLAGGGVDITDTDGSGNSFTYTGTGTDTANVSVARDTDNITTNGGSQILVGDNTGDTFSSGSGNDIIFAGGGNDELVGGAGADVLVGGAGTDDFNFDDGDSGVGAGLRDIILDFLGGGGDEDIDLSAIDANTTVGGGGGGGQAFTFIGTAAFSDTTAGGQLAAGQVRYELFDSDGNGSLESTLIQANVNNNLTADYEILLKDFTGAVITGDFVL